MAVPQRTLLFVLLFLIVKAYSSASPEASTAAIPHELGRSDFPKGFLFGAASSAYQYEGAAKEGGRGPSIWDTFTHKHPEKIKDRGNGDVAVDSYHRYKEDVSILKSMGLDAYRFSISWSRILPRGSIKGGINREGINYYNNLINTVVFEGLQPFATLTHFDTPQALEDQYGGFLSDKIAADFRDYAEICFREFGDRVKHWITLNEPWTYANLGYASGKLAPGRCSRKGNSTRSTGGCPAGDSGREPYLVAHNQLLAHAAAASLYKAKFQATQKGLIGITMPSSWFLPMTDTKRDRDAAQRALEFMFGWFMDPLTEGDYPFIVRALVRDRLPRFTKEQSKMVKGSFDFLGLNYYTSNYAKSIPFVENHEQNYLYDAFTQTSGERNGRLIGPQAGASWIFIYPKGLKELLLYIKQKYQNPIIYITENGVGDTSNNSLPLKESLEDNIRVYYHKGHLIYLQESIREGVDVRGYFAWSLLDNFEWTDGYTIRFGMNYVDFKNGLKRYPKKSAMWFQSFLKR